jgi:hypothetical protein
MKIWFFRLRHGGTVCSRNPNRKREQQRNRIDSCLPGEARIAAGPLA